MQTNPTRDLDAAASARNEADEHLSALLDEALEESFPASDPIALGPRDAIASSLPRTT